MIPAMTALAKTAANTPPRFFGGFVPHGMAPGYWIPETRRRIADELPFIWKPLEPFRKQPEYSDAACIRARPSRLRAKPVPTTGWLRRSCVRRSRGRPPVPTFTPARPSTRSSPPSIGQETLLPSMQIAVEDPGANSSNCGEGYSCVYTNTISWASPTTPLPMELNPQVVFERMFGRRQHRRAARAAPQARPEHPRFAQRQHQEACAREISAPDRARLDRLHRERPRNRAPAADRR